MNSGIRKQDGASVICVVAMNRIGRDMTWDWLRSNWKIISKYFDTAISAAIGHVIKVIAVDFNTELKLNELIAFYELNKAGLGTAKKDTEIAIQLARANVKWMDKNYKIIVDWLNDHL